MPDTCDTVDTARVYLCDSGAQYKSGTTDVTRTVHFGTPTQEEKDSFTYVLKVGYHRKRPTGVAWTKRACYT